MSALSIVIILHSNIRSGSNLVTFMLAASLARRGHRVEVVFQERAFPADIGFFDSAPPFTVGFLDERPASSSPADIVLTTWWECAYRFHRIPARCYAYYRHGDEKGLYDGHGRFFDAVIDAVLDEDLLVFCVNNALAAAAGAARGRGAVAVRNGVDYERFATARPSLPPKTRPLRVLVEGPLDDPTKRVAQTVAAVASLAGVETVHVTARGEPSADPRVAHRFTGMPYAAMPGILASCDVIVKMGTAETWSMPVLETFAAGGTAVTGAFPGHDDYIVDGGNALVVPLDGWAGLRAAVDRLATDAPLLGRLRTNARSTAQRLSWDEPVAMIEAAFRAAVGRLPADHVAPTPRLDCYRACHQAILDLWLKAQAPAPSSPENAAPVIAGLQQALAAERARTEAANRRMDAILRSKSWTLTAPLRALAQKLSRR